MKALEVLGVTEAEHPRLSDINVRVIQFAYKGEEIILYNLGIPIFYRKRTGTYHYAWKHLRRAIDAGQPKIDKL